MAEEIKKVQLTQVLASPCKVTNFAFFEIPIRRTASGWEESGNSNSRSSCISKTVPLGQILEMRPIFSHVLDLQLIE